MRCLPTSYAGHSSSLTSPGTILRGVATDEDKLTIDSLDVSQWQFYVLPKRVLDARARRQHSITLRSLKKIAGQVLAFGELKEAVGRAAEQQFSHES